jgi:predicted ATP-grasp superfamily ATP-dependent carboligase
MSDRAAIIIVANSARALACSARRAGFAPLSIDVFGDDDTKEMSLAAIRLDGGLSDGLTPDKVVGAVQTLISAYAPIGLVYGSGFEHQTETIAKLAPMTRIFGNKAETLKRAKDPLVLAELCAAGGIAHPPIGFETPHEPELWLVKRRGGAGGAHIAAATNSHLIPSDRYFQRRVIGEGVSALFVANGREAAIIGLSAQWTVPTPESPFRYGGAVGPLEIGAEQTREVACAVAYITSELGLLGLNSADFLVSSDALWLLEINPRPGATLDIFETSEGSLFAHHLAACEGRLTPVPRLAAFKAAEIVYATRETVLREKRNWPDWVVDRPPARTRITAGDPLCTVLASGATVGSARICAKERAQRILACVQESEH